MKSNIDRKHKLFQQALDHTKVGLIITDPALEDHPIIYVNQGFINMTGYQADEIIGKNCRFLQGKETNPETIDAIREAIKQKESITVQLYNYKKDGMPFWNELAIDPMWIEEEQKLYFVGVQKDVTYEKEQERLLQEALNEMDELSTPIVPVAESVAVLPLIGSLHFNRIDKLTTAISTYLTNSKDDHLILDLSGLYEVDTYVASSILKLYDLTALIGTQLILTGIRPELAIKTTEIGEKLKSMKTYRTVRDAMQALQ
ncbi:blue-light photoreceptor [Paraliobacillus ryukyuensis]|uniref:PAS domain S-box-containing protein n=1 Tax=Paraliobacillus ryukyuensis TaxID=200904 RepID=A0A366DWA6_9BACI|nr:STAS domain-containing protein [Paraliobacillus ryukyuensis]RBO93544.1 PAS domain S-box-containing protein [Paraliobacillus ryukyuensis]